MNNEQKTKVESIVFKKLIEHLQNRTDVQNIDLMNLSGFCRNCLSRWYSEAAEETGIKIDKDFVIDVRTIENEDGKNKTVIGLIGIDRPFIIDSLIAVVRIKE